MIHAQLDANGLCTGYGDLKNIESHENLVYLPNGWDEDFLWRKYVNGQWSVEKYLPPVNNDPSEIDLIKKEIVVLQQRDASMQDDNALILETLINANLLV